MEQRLKLLETEARDRGTLNLKPDEIKPIALED
jgi:hypothetical protein